MSTVDRIIVIGSAVAIGVMGAVVVAFCEGIYKPIKHDMGYVSAINIERLRVDEDASGGLQLDTYNPQVTVNSNKMQGSE